MVKDGERWTRGECYEAKPDGLYGIQLLEYGAIDEFKAENIRKLPQHLAFESLTHLVFIESMYHLSVYFHCQCNQMLY